jgi:hypothetical protein
MSNIASATQDGKAVKVYDENGGYKFELYDVELVGYTSSTVTVRTYSGSSKTYGSEGEFKFER